MLPKVLYVAEVLCICAVLTTSADDLSQPWETDPSLPLDTKPSFYAVTLFPDFDHRNFTGNVNVDITVTAQKQYLWFHNDYTKISNAVVISMPDMKDIIINSTFMSMKNGFFVIQFDSSIPPGAYQLQLQYSGSYWQYSFPESFYLTYASDNTTRQILYKDHISPCFCQQRFRASLQIQVIRPTDNYQIISNTKPETVISDSPTTGFTTIKFKKTPVLNPERQLLTCSMDTLPTKVSRDGIAVTLYARKEALKNSEFIFKIIVFALDYYADFFNFSLPMEKYDVISVPPEPKFGSSAAFSNWGLVLFREGIATYERGVTTSWDQFNNAKASAHEPGHLWLQDTAGSTWFSDLFLVEGTVSFLQYKVLEALYPTWNVLEYGLTETTYYSLRYEADPSTLPLVPVVPSVHTNRDDHLNAYYKGSTILRMLECYMGEENFRSGFRNYMATFAFKSSEVDDLWSSMQPYTSKFNVTRMMNTWTQQNTYPVVTATRNNNQLILTQSRFLENINSTYNRNDSIFGFQWDILVTGKGPNGFKINDKLWLGPENPTFTIELPDNVPWVKLNVLNCGFYRVNYDLDDWDRFAYLLEHNMTIFHPMERGNLVDDVFALAESGYVPYVTAMKLTKYIGQEDDLNCAVYTLLDNHLARLDSIMLNTPGYVYYRAYFDSILSPHINADAWAFPPDTPPTLREAQRLLLLRACYLQVKACVKPAKRIFDTFLLPCGNKPNPQIADAIYYYGMSVSGQYEWSILWARYLNETDEKKRSLYRNALCQVPVPWIIRHMLEVADRWDLISFIDVCSGNTVAVPVMWIFVQEKTEFLTKTYRNDEFPYILKAVTDSFSTVELLHQVETYFQGVSQQSLGSSDRQYILNHIQANILLKEKHLIPLTHFFKEAVASVVL